MVTMLEEILPWQNHLTSHAVMGGDGRVLTVAFDSAVFTALESSLCGQKSTHIRKPRVFYGCDDGHEMNKSRHHQIARSHAASVSSKGALQILSRGIAQRNNLATAE
jgi:hypothetical protein